MNEPTPVINTDREIWREREGDYFSPSIFVTEKGAIGINVGGQVIIRRIERWHEIATTSSSVARSINSLFWANE